MAKTVKSNNLPGKVAAKLFVELNKDYVWLSKEYDGSLVLATQLKPDDDRLVYPHGWYYAKHAFRNKHESDSGLYEEIKMECMEEDSVVLPPDMEEVTVVC